MPHLIILGTTIGDYLFCARYIAFKRTEAIMLLSWLVEVACFDPQVAPILLRMCGGYCKLVHLARATPPSLASDPLQLCDAEVRECFTLCTAVPVSNLTWQQAQLSLSQGGLGLALCFSPLIRLPTLPLFVLLVLLIGITNTLLTRLKISTVLCFPI